MNIPPPSTFVCNHIELIREGGHVLDLACGRGRHTRRLLERGFQVTAVDINIEGIADLREQQSLTTLKLDMEQIGDPWPISQHMTTRFDGIIVTNYLHRPQFPHIAESLAAEGILIFETFMIGNEQYGKPSNPNFLLKEDELMQAFESLTVVDFEQGYRASPSPAVVQSLCARADRAFT
ncbi:MAG: methyltransferase domain-containing protein [Pseudomonadota bacterium]